MISEKKQAIQLIIDTIYDELSKINRKNSSQIVSSNLNGHYKLCPWYQYLQLRLKINLYKLEML